MRVREGKIIILEVLVTMDLILLLSPSYPSHTGNWDLSRRIKPSCAHTHRVQELFTHAPKDGLGRKDRAKLPEAILPTLITSFGGTCGNNSVHDGFSASEAGQTIIFPLL